MAFSVKLFIKNFDIIIGFIICYNILNGRRKNVSKVIEEILFAVLLAITSERIDHYASYITIPIMFLILFYYTYHFIDKINCFVRTIIIFALNYVFFQISAIICGVILLIIWNNYCKPIDQLICLLLHLLIISFVFRFKRVKKAINILNNKIYYMNIWAISIIVISLTVIINVYNYNFYYSMFELILSLSALCLFIIWRTSLTKEYLDQLNMRNFISLNAELNEKNALIDRLKADNEHLKKMNHKNNKLVPAMYNAVDYFSGDMLNYLEEIQNKLTGVNISGNYDKILKYREEEERLLSELHNIKNEWQLLADQDADEAVRKIPSTGVTRIDYIIRYMYSRADKESIRLNVVLECEVPDMFVKIISEDDLATLIADLIENALIATKHNGGKDILVKIGLLKKEYAIEIFDSGISFTKEVLFKYGNEQYTTHADDGGSGIGMMQTAEILNKCGASLYIDEYSQNEGLYTKKISVVFNRKHQYVLYTDRSDEDVSYLKKRGDLIIVRKI